MHIPTETLKNFFLFSAIHSPAQNIKYLTYIAMRGNVTPSVQWEWNVRKWDPYKNDEMLKILPAILGWYEISVPALAHTRDSPTNTNPTQLTSRTLEVWARLLDPSWIVLAATISVVSGNSRLAATMLAQEIMEIRCQLNVVLKIGLILRQVRLLLLTRRTRNYLIFRSRWVHFSWWKFLLSGRDRKNREKQSVIHIGEDIVTFLCATTGIWRKYQRLIREGIQCALDVEGKFRYFLVWRCTVAQFILISEVLVGYIRRCNRLTYCIQHRRSSFPVAI